MRLPDTAEVSSTSSFTWLYSLEVLSWSRPRSFRYRTLVPTALHRSSKESARDRKGQPKYT